MFKMSHLSFFYISSFEGIALPFKDINCTSILIKGLKPNGGNDKEIKTNIIVQILNRRYDVTTRKGIMNGIVLHKNSVYNVTLETDYNPEKEVSYYYKITGATKMFALKRLNF